MFRITLDPSSGSIDSYLIKTTRHGSTVLVCAVGVWRHIQDLWCVCVPALRRIDQQRRWPLRLQSIIFRTHTTERVFPTDHIKSCKIPVSMFHNWNFSNMFWFPLSHHGKTFVSVSYGNGLLYSPGSGCANFIFPCNVHIILERHRWQLVPLHTRCSELSLTLCTRTNRAE
jgi:hypothetical protein